MAVCEDNFNFLTKMCLLRNRELACWMARTAHAAGVPAIVNGSDASDRAAEYLAAGFSYVLEGEVEDTIVEVTRLLFSGAVPGPEPRGIAFLDAAIRRTAANAPPRAHRRSGFAAHAGVGSDRCRRRTARLGPPPTAISR